ncbi:MAG: efflux RND transporter periplasmic adaptor subunit [Alphaproteobacteria bacterium]
MKKSVLIAIIISLGAGAWIFSGQFANGARDTGLRKNGEGEVTVQTSGEKPTALAKVRVAKLVATPRVNLLIINGRTEASRSVRVRAETDSRVAEIYINKGDRVETGQIIARLTLDDRQAKLAEAEALLRQRDIEFNAAEQLQVKGFRSQTSLAAAMAQLDGARAVVERMRIDIARTEIRAPFSGIIGNQHAEVGDYLKAGDIAATVIDLDPIVIVGYATEREVGQLQVGILGKSQIVGVAPVEGVVSYVAHTADSGTRTYRFELEVDNADNGIRDGLTSVISVATQSDTGHLVSPSVLTLADSGAIGVKVVNSEQQVEFLAVDILADTPDGVWLGSLPDAITLITVGQDFVVPGQTVEPIEAAGPIKAGSTS